MSNKSRRKQSTARAKQIARQEIAKSVPGTIPASSYAPAPAMPTRAAATPVTTQSPATTRPARATSQTGKITMMPTLAYMGRDLRRIGIIGGIMIAVIAILSRFI